MFFKQVQLILLSLFSIIFLIYTIYKASSLGIDFNLYKIFNTAYSELINSEDGFNKLLTSLKVLNSLSDKNSRLISLVKKVSSLVKEVVNLIKILINIIKNSSFYNQYFIKRPNNSTKLRITSDSSDNKKSNISKTSVSEESSNGNDNIKEKTNTKNNNQL